MFQLFAIIVLVIVVISGAYAAFTDDYDPDWNNDCSYGATYTYPDGHTVVHSPDCK